MIKSFKQQQLHEASLSRIWQHSHESNMGIITAYRGEFDVSQNEKRNKELVSSIRSSGFGFIPVTGFYVENPGQEDEKKVKENSFVVISSPNDSGKLRSFLIKMGIKFNQDSVFYKDASKEKAVLIGTAQGRWPGLNNQVEVGKFVPQKIGAYYTKMRGHRTFVFESVELPETLMTRAYREKIESSK